MRGIGVYALRYCDDNNITLRARGDVPVSPEQSATGYLGTNVTSHLDANFATAGGVEAFNDGVPAAPRLGAGDTYVLSLLGRTYGGRLLSS